MANKKQHPQQIVHAGHTYELVAAPPVRRVAKSAKERLQGLAEFLSSAEGKYIRWSDDLSPYLTSRAELDLYHELRDEAGLGDTPSREDWEPYEQELYQSMGKASTAREVVYKGYRYVLALEKDEPPPNIKDIPTTKRPTPTTQPRKFGPPSTFPGGQVDPELIQHPGVQQLERESLQQARDIDTGDIDIEGFLRDVESPAVLNATKYIYHTLPTLSGLFDIINNSALVGYIEKMTKRLTNEMKEAIINKSEDELKEILSNPLEHKSEVDQIKHAIFMFYTQVPQLVGASEVLTEALRVLTNQLTERGVIPERKFKETKAEYKKLIDQLANFDPAARKSVQQQKPEKGASGKPARGKPGRNPLLQG